MKILITGASGFVGPHLSAKLKERGHEITTLGFGGADTDVTIDLLDADAVRALKLSSYDGIIHLAGLAAVGPSYEQPRRYIDANAGMQINLLETCLTQHTTPRVLIVSSGTLYDTGKLPIAELAPLNPSSPYAVSKITQEQLGTYYARRGFEVIVARPFNHIGPGQLPGFIVPDLAQQIAAVQRGAAQRVMIGNLDSRRDYTDVRDIVTAYGLLIEGGRPGEIYNVCSGHSVSGHELLEGLRRAANVTFETAPDPKKLRPSDVPDIYGSHAKLTADTGWEPAIPLSQTLTDVMDDWRTRHADV